jgi:hypothetical protein
VKKEILIAIVIGFALGLVITFGIWTANQALKQQAQLAKPTPTQEVEPTPPPEVEKLSLIITTPEDDSISSEEKIEVSGETASFSTVVILYPEGEVVIQADQQGNFSSEITLVGGANEIKIAAWDQNGNEVSKTLNVVYSTAEI